MKELKLILNGNVGKDNDLKIVKLNTNIVRGALNIGNRSYNFYPEAIKWRINHIVSQIYIFFEKWRIEVFNENSKTYLMTDEVICDYQDILNDFNDELQDMKNELIKNYDKYTSMFLSSLNDSELEQLKTLIPLKEAIEKSFLIQLEGAYYSIEDNEKVKQAFLLKSYNMIGKLIEIGEKDIIHHGELSLNFIRYREMFSKTISSINVFGVTELTDLCNLNKQISLKSLLKTHKELSKVYNLN